MRKKEETMRYNEERRDKAKREREKKLNVRYGNRGKVLEVYHAVVQHSVGHRRVRRVLAVQVLTDHLNVSLLTHLLSRLHPKTDVASVTRHTARKHQSITH